MTDALSGQSVCLINAGLPGGEIGSLRTVADRIASLHEPPRPGDVILDLEGDRVLPGLINAHDHLQLNSLPSLGRGQHYAHVRQWIADINERRRSDAEFEAQVKTPRRRRLLVGGMKNLLSGVTTVAHHDPLYEDLLHPDYPVDVVTRFGWSHSLYIDGPKAVQEAYGRTPSDWPWIIHAAEGIDEEAAQEFDRLEILGCLGANTLLVHGVALDHARLHRLTAASAGLLWCPASNLRLFDRTAAVHDLLPSGRIALGTDSRLSGSRDLLDELQRVGEFASLGESCLEALVTHNGAQLLRLPDRGSLQVGRRADILVLPPGMALSQVSRAAVRLVIRGGVVRYADKAYAGALRPVAHWVDVEVDGSAKLLDGRIVELLLEAGAEEDGLHLVDSSRAAA